jgi:hypothetical protein
LEDVEDQSGIVASSRVSDGKSWAGGGTAACSEAARIPTARHRVMFINANLAAGNALAS